MEEQGQEEECAVACDKPGCRVRETGREMALVASSEVRVKWRQVL